ncbi:MAG: hypothetical protein K0R14_1734 [Burkholderiales bacterium]|jgi:hypothetical protein|nr:hypothetical protein [Burkholderiales bacterium]
MLKKRIPAFIAIFIGTVSVANAAVYTCPPSEALVCNFGKWTVKDAAWTAPSETSCDTKQSKFMSFLDATISDDKAISGDYKVVCRYQYNPAPGRYEENYVNLTFSSYQPINGTAVPTTGETFWREYNDKVFQCSGINFGNSPLLVSHCPFFGTPK